MYRGPEGGSGSLGHTTKDKQQCLPIHLGHLAQGWRAIQWSPCMGPGVNMGSRRHVSREHDVLGLVVHRRTRRHGQHESYRIGKVCPMKVCCAGIFYRTSKSALLYPCSAHVVCWRGFDSRHHAPNPIITANLDPFCEHIMANEWDSRHRLNLRCAVPTGMRPSRCMGYLIRT